MNTLQILNVLKSDLGSTFLGVFPSDDLPPIFTKPAALVMNLDPKNAPGSHWVCMYFDKRGDKCEYFDSYGNAPNEQTRAYMLQYASKIKHNKKCVQMPLTATCGQLCIYFLVWRSRGVAMKSILSSLEQSYADEFVTGFVNNLFKLNTKVVDKHFIANQYGTILRNFTEQYNK